MPRFNRGIFLQMVLTTWGKSAHDTNFLRDKPNLRTIVIRQFQDLCYRFCLTAHFNGQ